MKINKYIKLVALLAVSATAMTGCIKETFPESNYATAEQVGNSPFAAAGMIYTLPTPLITNYTGQGQKDFGYPALMMAYDYMAGEFIPNSYGWDYTQFYWTLLQDGHAANHAMPYIYWNNYYVYIKNCNDILAAYGSVESQKVLAGTARVFRAFCYLDMARLYEGLPAETQLRPEYATELEKVKGLTVPIVSELTAGDDAANNPRATREEIFTFIFSDLDAAEAAFGGGYVPESKAFPSLAVVYGLKARAYLWLGGFEEGLYAEIPTGNAAYKKAAEYARMAITASGATPLTEAQYTDKTNGFNTVNAAWMWAMIQSQDTVLSNLHSFTAQIAPEGNWGYGGIIGPGVRKCVYDRMSDTDFRKKVIVGPTTTYADFAQYTNIPSAAAWKQWGAFGYGVYPYTSFKFRPAGGEISNSSTGNPTSIPLMRVEEMLLIEAEATAHYDAATGKSLLESFMALRDPNYTYTATDLVEEIIFQKRVELWGEGLIVFDLKRLDYGIDNAYEGTNAKNGFRFKTDHRVPLWNFCIPLSEVQQNVALDGKNNPDPSAALKSHDVAGE